VNIMDRLAANLGMALKDMKFEIDDPSGIAA
jgi:hypothetical protein